MSERWLKNVKKRRFLLIGVNVAAAAVVGVAALVGTKGDAFSILRPGAKDLQALEKAVAMHDAELQAFEWSAARLPDFRREFGVELAGAIRIYVAGLRSWVRGNTAWSWETPRYKGYLSMCGHAAEV